MAKLLGTSGAWRSICSELNQASFKPEKPSDIYDFLKATQKEYALAKSNAAQDVKDKIALLKKDVESHEENFESNVQSRRDKISAEIDLDQLAIQMLQAEAGLIRKIVNYFKVKKYEKKIQQRKANYANCPRALRKNIDSIKESLRKAQLNFDFTVENQCRPISYKVELLDKVLKSPDFAGGIAELEAIESLRTLPDNYYVISDVNLEAGEAIYFDGEWLKSAQIDHVVVAPSGIFVIEVKNWSKKFIQEGDFFDPYQQVKRSTYLCYKLIGEKYNLKTRSIIAYKGSIPEKPHDSYAKVLRIDGVKGYILWFKDSIASDQVIEMIANWFVFKRSSIW